MRRKVAPPPLAVDVAWKPHTGHRAARLLEQAARRTAAAEGFVTGQLSIAVVGRRAMATLHERYARVSGPTDVLTFDLGTDRRRGTLDGEIVVCADVARQQSRARTGSTAAATVRAELALYVVHGVLHLAGYDDHAPADFRRMHAREDELLRQLGLGPVFAGRDTKSE